MAVTETVGKALNPFGVNFICNLHGIDEHEYERRKQYVLQMREAFDEYLEQDFNAALAFHRDKLRDFVMAETEIQEWKKEDESSIDKKKKGNDQTDDVFWDSMIKWIPRTWKVANTSKEEKEGKGRKSLVGAFDWRSVIIKIRVEKWQEFAFVVGAMEGLTDYEKVYRRGISHKIFKSAVLKAMGAPQGKQWPPGMDLIYMNKEIPWNLNDEDGFDSALRLFEDSDEAKDGAMLLTVEDERPPNDLKNFWANTTDESQDVSE